VALFVLDIESVVDYDLVSQLNRSNDPVKFDVAAEVTRRATNKGVTQEKYFWPPLYHSPVCVVGLWADDMGDFQGITQIVDTDPKKVTTQFWDVYRSFQGSARVVTFNGKRFDMPVLEARALHYGVPLTGWMVLDQPAWEDPRAKFNTARHWDLNDYAPMGGGGLSEWARLVGLPGKIDTDGGQVDKLLQDGKLDEIVEYCTCDVINTYGLMLKYMQAMGWLEFGEDVYNQKLMAARKTVSGKPGGEIERFWRYLDSNQAAGDLF